jgi:hypothetical protein
MKKGLKCGKTGRTWDSAFGLVFVDAKGKEGAA